MKNWLSLSDTMILLSVIVYLRYCNNHLNFALYSLLLLITMVHRNDKAGSMSVLTSFDNQSSFATIECMMSASFFSSLV